MASSTISTASSGYSSQASASVNPRYACYWLDSCRGLHELNQCLHWQRDLRGKKGIYYSPSGLYKRFSKDLLSSVNLENNPTGCTMVYLLIYTIRTQTNEIEILFGLRSCQERGDQLGQRPLLIFPSTKPHKRNESGKAIALRTFEWITDRVDIASQNFVSRFLFRNAGVIYPLYLTNEQADRITQNFTFNEQILSLHWFPLTYILSQLPRWDNYLISEATSAELAQYDDMTNPIGIQLGQYQLWSVTTTSLMCIREHVPNGFQEFLKVPVSR